MTILCMPSESCLYHGVGFLFIVIDEQVIIPLLQTLLLAPLKRKVLPRTGYKRVHFRGIFLEVHNGDFESAEE